MNTEPNNNPAEPRKSVIEAMAAQLGEMAQRAADAEQRADKAETDAAEWYQFFQNKDEELKKVQKQLTDEITAHKETKEAFDRLLNVKKEGAQENG